MTKNLTNVRSSEAAGEDKGLREQERRRKKYKFALVRWEEMDSWEGYPTYAVEHKDVLRTWWQHTHTVLCDDQPEKVLRAMLKLMKEDEDD